MASSIPTQAGPLHYSIKHVASTGVHVYYHNKIIPTQRSLNDFGFLKYISRGASGIVYLIRDKLTDKEYALKVLSKVTTGPADALNEQRLQTLVECSNSPFLLPLRASWHDSRNYYLVCDYKPGGDLALELARLKFFDETRARFYTAQMVLMVEELPRYRIVHRDIKPTNLLLSEDGYLSLTDFGLAKKFEAPKEFETLDSPTTSFDFDVDPDCDSGAFFANVPTPQFKTNEICGTSYFMSPQRTTGRDYGNEEDLWSVGVMLYLMLTGRMPFGNDYANRADIAFCVQYKTLQFEPTDLISDDAKSLLYGMLAKDTRTRLSLEQVKRHAFFREINWEKIQNREIDAPWLPYIAPLPKDPISVLPIVSGVSYEESNDPLPAFKYTSLKMDQRKLEPVVEEKDVPTPGGFAKTMAKVFGLAKEKETGSKDFSLEKEVEQEADDDDDCNHLPIQIIDYSELPLGSHPLDHVLYPNGDFALESVPREGGKQDNKALFNPNSLLAALAEIDETTPDAQFASAPKPWAMSVAEYKDFRAQARPAHVPERLAHVVNSAFDISKRFPPHLKHGSSLSICSPARPQGLPTSLSVQTSFIPPVFYRQPVQMNHDLESADTNFYGDNCEGESDDSYGLFHLDRPEEISGQEDDHSFEYPRPAPTPSASLTPPLSPNTTLTSPTLSPTPTLVNSDSPCLSRSASPPTKWEQRRPPSNPSWPTPALASERQEIEGQKARQEFLKKYESYRLKPEHIRLRRELDARKRKTRLEEEQRQKDIEAMEESRSNMNKGEPRFSTVALRPLDMHRVSLTATATAAPTTITVTGDLEVNKRQSQDALKNVEEAYKRVSASEGFFGRLREYIGKVFGTSGVEEQISGPR